MRECNLLFFPSSPSCTATYSITIALFWCALPCYTKILVLDEKTCCTNIKEKIVPDPKSFQPKSNIRGNR